MHPSVVFYNVSPPKYGSTVALAVMSSILTVVVVIMIYLLLKNRRRACTTIPAPPSDVSAGYLSLTQFIVQWQAVGDAESYTVYVGPVTRFAISTSVNITTTRNSRATITGLTINRTYYIVVTATNRCGESIPSPEITFTYS